jgi:hypothetical protein
MATVGIQSCTQRRVCFLLLKDERALTRRGTAPGKASGEGGTGNTGQRAVM